MSTESYMVIQVAQVVNWVAQVVNWVAQLVNWEAQLVIWVVQKVAQVVNFVAQVVNSLINWWFKWVDGWLNPSGTKSSIEKSRRTGKCGKGIDRMRTNLELSWVMSQGMTREKNWRLTVAQWPRFKEYCNCRGYKPRFDRWPKASDNQLEQRWSEDWRLKTKKVRKYWWLTNKRMKTNGLTDRAS